MKRGKPKTVIVGKCKHQYEFVEYDELEGDHEYDENQNLIAIHTVKVSIFKCVRCDDIQVMPRGETPK